MINLRDHLGFGIHLHETALIFEEDVSPVKPAYRHLSEMEAVIFDWEWYIKTPKDLILYDMYRNLFRLQHRELFQTIRYDITVIPPRLLGQEWVKTAGHYHPKSEAGLPYPEIYQVAHGTAHYLLQKPTTNPALIEDVVLVSAVPGDVVVIPPEYGHITINPDEETLVMVNLVARTFSSEYDLIKRLHGGAYFETKDHGFLKNTHYEYVPELRQVDPPPSFESLKKGVPIYTSYCQEPSALQCLVAPNEQIFAGILE